MGGAISYLSDIAEDKLESSAGAAMSTGRAGLEVLVTGLGMVSPAGCGATDVWESMCAARPTAATVPELAGLPVDFACRVPDFTPHAVLGEQLARRTDRCTQLALVAAYEALAMARLAPKERDSARIGVVMGTAFGGIGTIENQAARLANGVKVSPVTVPMFAPNMLAGQISLELGALGPSFVVSTACASGTTAIGLGANLLRSGVCDVVLAGGAEAPVNRLTTAAFARMGALSKSKDEMRRASRPFDAKRDGFVLGEGAAVLVMETESSARARQVAGMARIAGYGDSCDAHHITAPHPDGAGLERAVHAALAAAGANAADIDHINAHATSTPLGDLAESQALARVFRHRPPTVTSSKGTLGHTMGAAGAIEAALTILAINHGQIPPTGNLRQQDPRVDLDVVTGSTRPQHIRLALSTSCGFGGANAALALCPA